MLNKSMSKWNRNVKKTRLRNVVVSLGVLVLLLGIVGCSPNQEQGLVNNNQNPTPPGPAEFLSDDLKLLDDTFRIDIKEILVTFDYVPDSSYVDCHAEVSFRMRPGQQRPLVHLDPVIKRGVSLGLVRLNGEILDANNTADVATVKFDSTTQQAIQFQRDLAQNQVHLLELSYRLQVGGNPYHFMTNVNDIQGNGNEEWFPTLNSPEELSHHVITFRVHSDKPYRCIGSGLVQSAASDKQAGTLDNVQQWTLDTEREVASYTIMFVLMPEEDTLYKERTINGVDVRVMSYNGGPDPDFAFKTLETWLPQLENDLGVFPMPRGLSLFLTLTGGGMEYFGGSITSLGALKHEVFHMYYACSTVNRTFRDSWLDEAINQWYEFSMMDNYQPISETYNSGIVGNRSPIAVGFDTRAYDQGSRIIQAVAIEMGSRDNMLAFLRHLHQNHSFAPFTTYQFLDILNDYSGLDMNDQFRQWLYTNGSNTYNQGSSEFEWLHNVDITPPETILRKYNLDK
jgi:hypothetical protein